MAGVRVGAITPIESRWLPVARRCRSSGEFLLKALAIFLLASMRRRRRTPATVRENYDAERGRLLARVAEIDWQTYIFGPDERDFVLIDGVVRDGHLPEARQCLLCRLEQIVASVPAASTIVEFGSGDGRNLLYLKRLFPTHRMVGFELSPVSVDAARAAARRFGLDISFHVANVCEPMTELGKLKDVSLTFSVHALEQMPRIYTAAVRNMVAASRDIVAMLEPVPELMPWTFRGMVSRLRIVALDRLRGLAGEMRSHAASGAWRLEACRATGFGDNPLNETCEIVLKRLR
jgi:hypothetical protein